MPSKEEAYKDFLDKLLDQPNNNVTPPPNLPSTQPKEPVVSSFVPKAEKPRLIPKPSVMANNANSMMFEDVIISDMPMGEFYYPGTRIQFRDLKVKEIEHFSTLDETSLLDFKDKINDILENCVLFNHPDGTTGDYTNIFNGDRLWMIYMIREKTFPKGKVLTVNVEYQEGEATKSVDIELVRANVDIYRDDDIMGWFIKDKRVLLFETELRDEPFVIAPPTIGLSRCFDVFLKAKVENAEEVNREFFKICPYLQPHVAYMSYEELEEFYTWFEEGITPDEFSFLHDLITNHLKIGIRGLKKRWVSEILPPIKYIPADSKLFSCFQMPLMYLLRNKKVLYQYPYNLTDETIDNWQMWKFQTFIDMINEEGKDALNSINPQTTENNLK